MAQSDTTSLKTSEKTFETVCEIAPETIIIADDLTGACDAALQFFDAKSCTRILLDAPRAIDLVAAASSSADNHASDPVFAVNDISAALACRVLALSTETRNLSENKAKAAVRKIFKNIKSKNIYKKIDSTLRGNIGAEFDAILEVAHYDAILIAPAYPAQKRTTVGARQFLNGLPLEETIASNDPKKPAKTSFIPNILSGKAGIISTTDLEAGCAKEKIKEFIKKGIKYIIADATKQKHLEIAADAIEKLKNEFKILPAGSAGLALALKKTANLSKIQPPVVKENKAVAQKPPKDLPVLFVSGSLTDLSKTQIKNLEERYSIKKQDRCEYRTPSDDSHCANLCPQDKKYSIRSFKIKEKDILDNFFYDVQTVLKNGENAIIHTTLLKQNPALADKITLYLAECIKKTDIAYNLVLIGGETAHRCTQALDIKYLEILDLISPAIPLLKDDRGRIIVTKSGNFGTPSTLIEILEYLK